MALYSPASRRQDGRELLRDQLVEETGLIDLGMVVLVSDVTADDMFINADGGDKVASCPQGLLFVKTTHPLDFLFQPPRGLSFQDLHDVGNRVTRCCEQDKMNVVDLNVQLDDFPMFPFREVLEDSFQLMAKFLVSENLSSVLGRPYQVVFNVVKTV